MRLHSDNGTQLILAVVQKLTHCLKIKQTFTPVYHPEANPVERKNRDLKVQLAIYTGKNHDTWDLQLPAIRFAMNTTKCASTNYSAAFLTFGRDLRTPFEVQHDLRAIVEAENFVPQITPHLLRLAYTLKFVKETEEKMQDKNKEYADRKRKPQVKIDVGDHVLVSTNILSNKDNLVSSKLVPRRDGSYVVLATKGSSCYTVASLEKPNEPLATYHASDLVLYTGKPDKPIYPLRKRGRPKQTSCTNIDSNTSACNSQNRATHKSIATTTNNLNSNIFSCNNEPKTTVNISTTIKDTTGNKDTDTKLRRSLRNKKT